MNHQVQRIIDGSTCNTRDGNNQTNHSQLNELRRSIDNPPPTTATSSLPPSLPPLLSLSFSHTHQHHQHHLTFQLIVCALLVAPMREAQVVMSEDFRSSARRHRERMRATLRHEGVSIAMHLAQALHQSTSEAACERVGEWLGGGSRTRRRSTGTDEASTGGAARATCQYFCVACVGSEGFVASQRVEDVVSVPKLDADGLVSGTEELANPICWILP